MRYINATFTLFFISIDVAFAVFVFVVIYALAPVATGVVVANIAYVVVAGGACKIVLRMSVGSYSGFARHEHAQR